MRVSTDQKQRWEREAMDRGFNSLAAFIAYTLEDAILHKQQPDKRDSERNP